MDRLTYGTCAATGVLNMVGDRCQGILACFAGAVLWDTPVAFAEALAGDNPEYDLERLLELRAYGENFELHAWRDAIGPDHELSWRLRDDEGLDGAFYLDGEQLLDVDESRSEGFAYVATGGGAYTLPVAGAEKILIRDYIDYDEHGMARVVDFRIRCLK